MTDEKDMSTLSCILSETKTKRIPTEKLTPLVTRDGMSHFYVEFTPNPFRFTAYNTMSWNVNNEPCEAELYASGKIKHGGCSHIYFGDNADTPGYLHICGGHCWENHIMFVKELYELAAKSTDMFIEDEKD